MINNSATEQERKRNTKELYRTAHNIIAIPIAMHTALENNGKTQCRLYTGIVTLSLYSLYSASSPCTRSA